MGATGEMPPKSLSIRRYASEDMQSVGLDSPRHGNRKCKSWPNYDEDGWAASCVSFIGPFDGPVLGGETLAQLATSWCVPSEVLLAWRMLVFLYMVGTSFYLGQRGSLTKYTLSAELYLLSVVASVMLLIPCFLPRRSGGFSCFGGARLSRTVSGFGRRHSSASPEEIGGVACCGNLQQVLFTTTTIVLQSSVSLGIFWDIVFWTRLRTFTDSGVDTALLHSYNIVPLVVELLCGNTEFSLVYIFPSFLFLCTYLGNAAYYEKITSTAPGAESAAAPNWITQLFAGSSNPVYDWTALMALYSVTCITVFLVQRLRLFCGRWMAERQEAHGTASNRRRSTNTDCKGKKSGISDDDDPWAE